MENQISEKRSEPVMEYSYFRERMKKESDNYERVDDKLHEALEEKAELLRRLPEMEDDGKDGEAAAIREEIGRLDKIIDIFNRHSESYAALYQAFENLDREMEQELLALEPQSKKDIN